MFSVKSYLPAELQVTAPKGSTKVLTGVPKKNFVVVRNNPGGNSTQGNSIQSRLDDKSEVNRWFILLSFIRYCYFLSF